MKIITTNSGKRIVLRGHAQRALEPERLNIAMHHARNPAFQIRFLNRSQRVKLIEKSLVNNT